MTDLRLRVSRLLYRMFIPSFKYFRRDGQICRKERETMAAPGRARQITMIFLNAILRAFLIHFRWSAVYKLDLDISTQENSVKEAEKKMNKLKDDENSISKKIDQLQNDLKKNREDQEKQQQTIENELKKLEGLRSKKSS